MAGHRYEYLKLCLEDGATLDNLYYVATKFAQARLPLPIRQASALSKITALLKPNGKVRGICAGDAFRRLVSKALARQFGDVVRSTIRPFNFGLSNRGGTDALVHAVGAAMARPGAHCLLSIDGVGAFDHV